MGRLRLHHILLWHRCRLQMILRLALIGLSRGWACCMFQTELWVRMGMMICQLQHCLLSFACRILRVTLESGALVPPVVVQHCYARAQTRWGTYDYVVSPITEWGNTTLVCCTWNSINWIYWLDEQLHRVFLGKQNSVITIPELLLTLNFPHSKMHF